MYLYTYLYNDVQFLCKDKVGREGGMFYSYSNMCQRYSIWIEVLCAIDSFGH